MIHVRGRSDKYLTLPHEGATIASEIQYRVIHSRRLLLSKYQSNRARSFVLSAWKRACPRILQKWKKSNIDR